MFGAEDPEGQQLVQSIETTAEAHHAYEQLFNIAEFSQNPDNLFRQMSNLGSSNSQPSQETMATYVFARLLAENRIGEFLQLPDEFNSAVEEWLQQQVDRMNGNQFGWHLSIFFVLPSKCAHFSGILEALYVCVFSVFRGLSRLSL